MSKEMGVNENPSQVHGRLNEALRIGGYALKRAFEQLEWLLEEDRWRQVGKGYADVHEFLSTVQLPPGAPPDQRAAIAQRIKELQPDASQRAIAGVMGVDKRTVGRDLADRDGANAPPGDSDAVQGNDLAERSGANAPEAQPGRRHPDPRPKHLRAALREIKQARKLCGKGQIASRLRGTESIILTVLSELEGVVNV